MPLQPAVDSLTISMTAYCTVHHLAAVHTGDCVLVHSTAANMSVAVLALQLAAREGASVVATASSTSIRTMLRALGMRQVISQGSLEILLEISRPFGASVLVNGNTEIGEVANSLAILMSGGRFVEGSRYNVWSTQRIAQGA